MTEIADSDDAVGVDAGDAVTVNTVLAVRYNSPLIATDVSALTAAVETENAALAAPAGTVTLTGTVAALVFELKSSTTAPPAGAAPVETITLVGSDENSSG